MTYPATGWQQYAACVTADPELFYPPDGETPAARRRRETAAKAVCATCPVQVPCLNYARTMQPAASFDHGIYGGTTPTDRHTRTPTGGRPPLLTELESHETHTRVQTGGETVRAVAADLNLDPKTLYSAWKRYGLGNPVEWTWRQAVPA